MSRKRAFAVDAAEEFLRKQIAAGVYGAHSMLPTLGALSQRAGVSSQTMRKAAQRICKEGLLRSVPGHGLFCTGQASPGTASPKVDGADEQLKRRVSAWQRTAKRIAEDILTGAYVPHQQMPLLKELGYQYDVSFRTLRKALHKLVDDGLLVSAGRGFKVAPMRRSTAGMRVVLVGAWNKKYNFLVLGMHDEPFLRILEEECGHANLALDLIAVRIVSQGVELLELPSKQPCALPVGEEIIGYLFLANDTYIPGGDVLHLLAAAGKPVAVLDEIGMYDGGVSHFHNRFIRFFQMTQSSIPAREVARYLLTLGHRRIAYISPFHGALWSRRRLEGLRDVYNAAGTPDGVSAHAIDYPLLARGKKRSKIETFLEGYKRWKRTAPSSFVWEMEPFINAAEKHAVGWGELRYSLRPVFDTVLADTALTSWVTVTDFVAMLAREYLQEKHIGVPQRISLVSFDDSARALKQRITSYNFNIPAAARALLRFITSPRDELRRNPLHLVTIDGMLIRRASSGAAPVRSRG
ncbi:MAG: GntR family transcriptional regulator [Chitinivibrionales bacterium]|nr:GntR family transcriptional regulator [Chitinivibrionales bacterium]